MPLTGKKVGILAENNYQEMELWYPLLRFKEANATVHVIGAGNSDVYKSKLGYPVNVDIVANKINVADYDAIIIPGGYAPDIMRTHPAMVELVHNAFKKGKVVAAICHAAWMLASARVLEGKKATCYHAIKDDVRNAGAEYVDQAVVRDGNLITSRTPDDLPIFCKTIIEVLRDK